jgi:two-component system NarL family sensor kinase
MMTDRRESRALSIDQHLEKLCKRIGEDDRLITRYRPLMDDVRHKADQARWDSYEDGLVGGGTHDLLMSLLESHEAEKRRLSRELHDGLGQMLTHLKLQTQQCLGEVAASGKVEQLGEGWQRMQQLPNLLSEALQEVRSVCRAMRPSILDDVGVVAAIAALCRNVMHSAAGLQIEMEFSVSEPEIPEPVKITLYRIVQEALTNCIKYAEADSIRVFLGKVRGDLVLNIKDNGKGFDVKSGMGNGIGLISMRERAQAQQGMFSITSTSASGTQIQVSIPLHHRYRYRCIKG